MYGLPKDFDASFFVGLEVQQVAFSANTLDVSFESNISVTLESSYEYRTLQQGERVVESGSIPVVESRLMRLTGQRVASADAFMNGTLTLRFASGDELTFLDDNPNYESYRISRDGDETFV